MLLVSASAWAWTLSNVLLTTLLHQAICRSGFPMRTEFLPLPFITNSPQRCLWQIPPVPSPTSFVFFWSDASGFPFFKEQSYTDLQVYKSCFLSPSSQGWICHTSSFTGLGVNQFCHWTSHLIDICLITCNKRTMSHISHLVVKIKSENT